MAHNVSRAAPHPIAQGVEQAGLAQARAADVETCECIRATLRHSTSREPASHALPGYRPALRVPSPSPGEPGPAWFPIATPRVAFGGRAVRQRFEIHARVETPDYQGPETITNLCSG